MNAAVEYEISNFVYHELHNGDVVVQNYRGIVKINNATMAHYVKSLDVKTKQTISMNSLSNSFGEHSDVALQFLLKYGIVKLKQKICFDIEEIVLLSNNDTISEHFNLHLAPYFAESKLPFSTITTVSDFNFNNKLLIVFLNPYDKLLAKKIVSKIQEYESALLMMTYIYNNKFYMDSLYNVDWKKPCHLCHVGFIETQLRVNQYADLSYQGLIDILYHEDATFKVEAPISVVETYNMMTMILNQLDKFVFRTKGRVLYSNESLEDINHTFMLDLSTNKISRDVSIHWELCDCYE
ncbi:McbB family protein [Paenibacillus sp. 481]|uniref:McbB family protein n=1 Tax=Paenibacillus sp. 481 TaxID=2835869 RepID=UPI001E3A91C3|nr:McbB family protein [Paenibacillus sp. 481]UHA74286.1 McbB family protein [Paenibacillus sp. 481]